MKPLLPLLFLMGLIVLPVPTGHAADGSPISAAMNVTPLRLEMPAGTDATRFLVRNRASEKLDVQVRVFEWLQVDGEDQYRKTRDVAVSPSIVAITPGQAQNFHVVAANKPNPGREKRYRVVIDELPGPFKPEPGVAQTTLRLTVPLFVDRNPSRRGRVDIDARDGVVRISNPTDQTVRLTDIAFTVGERPVVLAPNLRSRYVHGGSWVELPLPPGSPCTRTTVRLNASMDSEKLDAVTEQVCA